MPVTAETPDELLERLETMGLERVKALHAKHHFEPRAHGLVRGWIQREEEALKPKTAPVEEAPPKPDPAIQDALRTARAAARDAKTAREAAAGARRMALIGAGLAGAALVVAILALFATALQ